MMLCTNKVVQWRLGKKMNLQPHAPWLVWYVVNSCRKSKCIDFFKVQMSKIYIGSCVLCEFSGFFFKGSKLYFKKEHHAQVVFDSWHFLDILCNRRQNVLGNYHYGYLYRFSYLCHANNYFDSSSFKSYFQRLCLFTSL